ncbi:hypothetical protein CNMCM8694_008064 [Aspergillus lentulus]|nr:hypothetical protein CNMCM8060_002691 [Aspergillus lentulus]KAF4194019.1 hypothetical protein CNMCM8694_008064 [Aspergillus lentulus]
MDQEPSPVVVALRFRLLPMVFLSSKLTMDGTCFRLVKRMHILDSATMSPVDVTRNCPNDPVRGDEVPACEGYSSSPGAKVIHLSGWADWYPPGSRDQYVVQALGMKWSNNDVGWWGPKQKPQACLDLAADEKITSFLASGGTMVDWINVTTSNGRVFFVEGSGGNPTNEGRVWRSGGWDGFCVPDLIVGYAPTFRCKEDGNTAELATSSGLK